MSKEYLEALKIGIPKLKKLYEKSAKKMSQNDILGFDLTFVYLDKALQRLEAIDNSNPSEALKCLDKLAKQIELDEDTDYWEIRNAHKTVEQALIKAQEQEKVLKIIFEKDVDIEYIKTCFYDEKGGLKEYNSWVGHDEDKELTQEEFDLLKRYCK